MQNVTWQCSNFDELTLHQLYAVLQARATVFVLEQNCPYLDLDDCDQLSQHLIAWNTEGKLAAYLRIVPPGIKFTEASLGRVITTALARGHGIGKQLLINGIAACNTQYPDHAIRIG
ncbi:MAG: GNAT family N-acetyltransferase, partial [Gammaproteobacteria bacterium]|nr:GNAT family N-acetyltransferase [Gammaproteobacteria bacterium]